MRARATAVLCTLSISCGGIEEASRNGLFEAARVRIDCPATRMGPITGVAPLRDDTAVLWTRSDVYELALADACSIRRLAEAREAYIQGAYLVSRDSLQILDAAENALSTYSKGALVETRLLGSRDTGDSVLAGARTKDTWFVLRLRGRPAQYEVQLVNGHQNSGSDLRTVLGAFRGGKYGALVRAASKGGAIVVERSWPIRTWRVEPTGEVATLHVVGDDSALVEHLAEGGPLRSWTAGPAIDLGGEVIVDLTNLETDRKYLMLLPRSYGETLGAIETRLAGVVGGDAKTRTLVVLDYTRNQRVRLLRY